MAIDYAGGGVSPLFQRRLLACYNVVEEHEQMLLNRAPPAFSSSAVSPAASLHLPFLKRFAAWCNSSRVKGGMLCRSRRASFPLASGAL
eukprot:6121574-Pyramimonas_sp.AAC.1